LFVFLYIQVYIVAFLLRDSTSFETWTIQYTNLGSRFNIRNFTFRDSRNSSVQR